MPRIAILNMAIGFLILFFAASAGSFVAFDLTEAFLKNKSLLGEWEATLLQSAHGHSNMFGMLHILFGLTLAYSPLASRWLRLQTVGLLLGSLAMGPGMMARAYGGPAESLDLLGCLIGAGLSASFVMLFTHSFALLYRFWYRS